MLENQFQKGIFAFKRNGAYLNSIKSSSEGTNPLRSIRDFTLDKKNRKIYVLDGLYKKVFVFDYDLNLIDSVDLTFHAYAMEIINDLMVFATTDEDEIVWVTDLTGKPLSKHFLDNKAQRLRQFRPFDKSEHEILYNHWEDNNIYRIDTTGQVQTYCTFAFNGLEGQSQSSIPAFTKIKNNVIAFCQIPELGNFTIVYNTQKHSGWRFSQLANDITYTRNFMFPILGKDKEHIITYLPSEYLLSEIAELEVDKQNEHFRKMAAKINKASNPLLVFLQVSNSNLEILC